MAERLAHAIERSANVPQMFRHRQGRERKGLIPCGKLVLLRDKGMVDMTLLRQLRPGSSLDFAEVTLPGVSNHRTEPLPRFHLDSSSLISVFCGRRKFAAHDMSNSDCISSDQSRWRQHQWVALDQRTKRVGTEALQRDCRRVLHLSARSAM
ncbi:hypothetical protein IG631_24225 [Alternaria alternata]|nr:hypothetical protein IG631_24225 [Alternaria alternata]